MGANTLGPGIPGDIDWGLEADSGRGGMVTGAVGTGTGVDTDIVVGAGAERGVAAGAVAVGNEGDVCCVLVCSLAGCPLVDCSVVGWLLVDCPVAS